MSEIFELIDFVQQCYLCNETIADGDIYYKHPKHGIVCERCPEFKDGGIKALEASDDKD